MFGGGFPLLLLPQPVTDSTGWMCCHRFDLRNTEEARKKREQYVTCLAVFQPKPPGIFRHEIGDFLCAKCFFKYPKVYRLVGSGDSWMYPYQCTPSWEIPIYALYMQWVFMGNLSPRIPRLNTINTMGTLLHPIVP